MHTTPLRSSGIPQRTKRRLVAPSDCKCGEGCEYIGVAVQVTGPVLRVVARRKHTGRVVIT
eukprot:scaffold13021_cov127-Isochrysis_galbana.AAC.5